MSMLTELDHLDGQMVDINSFLVKLNGKLMPIAMN